MSHLFKRPAAPPASLGVLNVTRETAPCNSCSSCAITPPCSRRVPQQNSSLRLEPGAGGVQLKAVNWLGDRLAPSGFCLINANDVDAAAALAQQCPALQQGNMVDGLLLAF